MRSGMSSVGTASATFAAMPSHSTRWNHTSGALRIVRLIDAPFRTRELTMSHPPALLPRRSAGPQLVPGQNLFRYSTNARFSSSGSVVPYT